MSQFFKLINNFKLLLRSKLFLKKHFAENYAIQCLRLIKNYGSQQ